MILLETATTTTIDTPATFTCAQCPFARLIEDNRYCCQVSQTAADVVRGHWEATVSCYEALAKAEAEAPIAPATASHATPTAVETDNQPPGRGDGRGRVQPVKTHDRNNAQLAIIREELAAIGIKFGKLIFSREDVKGWNVSWDSSPAALYWSSGNGWEISTRKGQAELAGNWEGFDLIEHLDCNGIELPE